MTEPMAAATGPSVETQTDSCGADRAHREPFTSVWMRAPRQPKNSGLRRDQIVAAAVELLDAEGLDALSMRKLGAKLGAGATSVYWYVANKDELLELAMDEVWALVQIPEPEQVPWREVITTTVYGLRVTLLEHPWMAGLFGQMPSVGPHAFAISDRLRRAFLSAGFTGMDVYLASSTVMGFVLGRVIPEIGMAKATKGGSYDAASVSEAMETLVADYPEMLEDFREQVRTEPEVARAVAYDFALLCMLDGLEARLRAAAADSPPAKDSAS